MHAEFKKLNLGIFQIHLLMENFKKLQSAHFFARIRELNDTKAATRRAYPLLAKLRNMVTRRILLGVREISAYVSLVDKIEG